ncbi:radical SAM protein [Streptomyces sp. NPDC020192]|uniref:radical SAM protein n=1 Tax=Streptomyces sp. NPDC020192 TaxID=3365066 RepID=UPI0037BC59A4
MLDQVAGITRVRMLYLQLLYRCNYTCKHCFHGELLKEPDQFELDEARSILDHFREVYRLDAVTLLGGEPLLYPHIAEVSAYAKQIGLDVEICTNGHRGFRSRIEAIAPSIDKFRVSLDGLMLHHDLIRQRGSFEGAIEMIDLAVGLGLTTGATMTVTDSTLDDVAPLARMLEEHGVTELKLHALRLVGNAAKHPDLEVVDIDRYADLHQQIREACLGIQVIYDSDLSPEPAGEQCSNLVAGGWLDRIESDPRGALTVSCKAVGRDVNAFRWDKAEQVIRYEPRSDDEFAAGIPDVVYETARVS